MGIRGKLIVCLLAVLLPLSGIGALSFHWFEQQLKARTELALANTLRLETSRINEILDGYSQDARNLAADTRIRDFVSAVNTYRQSQIENPSETSNTALFIEDKDEISTINLDADWPLQLLALDSQRRARVLGSSAVEIRIADREGLTLGETMGFSWSDDDSRSALKAMSSVKTVYGKAFISNSNQRHLGLASPIISASGDVVGAVLIEVPLKPITSVVSMHERAGETSEAYLAQLTENGNSQLITALRFDRKAAFNKIVTADKQLPINIAVHARKAQVNTALDYRGIESLSAVQKIPHLDWGLVIKMDASEAYAPIKKLGRSLTIAATIAVLLILAGYTFLLGPIAHRLNRTAQTAQKIRSGDLTVRVDDPHKDEIGKLARTIDSLARKLEEDHQKRLDVEQQLRHQASHDELTGLLNRKYANKLIEDLNEQRHQSHSVMFLDLNGFKDVNDFYGHAAGDEVLTSVAGRLLNAIPNNATLARWGGDEFVIILPDTDAVAAEVLTSDIHTAFEDPISTNEGLHTITTSIGLATSNNSKTLQETLTEADDLMYEDKRQKRDSRTVSSIAERTLERALEEDRIELWYEPIVSRDSDANEILTAAETKIRIRTKDGGIVLPEDLINEFDNPDLTIRLYEHALKTSKSSISRWKQTHIVSHNFRLIFNIRDSMWEVPKFISDVLPHFSSEDIAISATHELGKNTFTNLCTDVVTVDASVLKNLETISEEINAIENPAITICIAGIDSRETLATLNDYDSFYYKGRLFDSPLRAVDFISRWGRPASDSHIPLSDKNFRLRLAG